MNGWIVFKGSIACLSLRNDTQFIPVPGDPVTSRLIWLWIPGIWVSRNYWIARAATLIIVECVCIRPVPYPNRPTTIPGSQSNKPKNLRP
ncbi:MAG: hypothetical protein BWY82_02909 [Verrucomicrobia bacterium ADurb.Bin474]|nr:MAG: hypothetical protein BWY82_02909 [Verrucomicrobia bacterium ADurb.Bin474]